jgi:methionyl aminopeptidase
LQDGDIVNIDITIYHNGVHGDCSETVLLGNVDEKTKDLVITTYEAWQAAINICKPGVRYSEIGGAIEDVVEPKGYTSVREFCGHGVGRIFHTTPNVLHYRNNQRSGTMAPGMNPHIYPYLFRCNHMYPDVCDVAFFHLFRPS